ncbi:MAG: type II toxin-antitoxin system YafQ family toxin [Bacteroides oleiciplenus]|nr:type II toxin-antitoxin system YafQ family toxin [Bacteroides oleiciplenus]
MAYSLTYTGQFKKDLKRCQKRGLDIGLLYKVITLLQENGFLPAEYKPHLLSGQLSGYWECHIKPDWLLIWAQDDKELTLLLMNTGTHSDLF